MRVFIVTPERTGSTALQESLRAAGVECWRSHYLDLQLPANMDVATIQRKCASFCRFKAALDEPGPRVILTVVRDQLDRRLSGVWYSRHRELLQDFDGQNFGPEAEEHFVRKYRTLAYLDGEYGRRVYRHLGIPSPPEPGQYVGPDEVPIEVLRFERLSEDFRDFATRRLERDLPLQRRHSGVEVGGNHYATFRAWVEREFTGTGFLELS